MENDKAIESARRFLEPKIFPIDFSGFIRFHDGPHYEDNDILDADVVGHEKAIENGNKIAALWNAQVLDKGNNSYTTAKMIEGQHEVLIVWPGWNQKAQGRVVNNGYTTVIYMEAEYPGVEQASRASNEAAGFAEWTQTNSWTFDATIQKWYRGKRPISVGTGAGSSAWVYDELCTTAELYNGPYAEWKANQEEKHK